MPSDNENAWSISALLCDHAQVADSKLFISGGGITAFQNGNAISSIAMKIDVPWNAANEEHTFQAQLLNSDGNEIIGPDGTPVLIQGKFEQGRPPGIPRGTSIALPLAIGIGPLGLPKGQYVWHLDIDSTTINKLRFVVLN
jgi:hypothetical protein